MKLKSLLLAGTFVPALALLPAVSIVLPMSAGVAQAQAPAERSQEEAARKARCRTTAEAPGCCTAEACRSTAAATGRCATAASACCAATAPPGRSTAAAPSGCRATKAGSAATRGTTTCRGAATRATTRRGTAEARAGRAQARCRAAAAGSCAGTCRCSAEAGSCCAGASRCSCSAARGAARSDRCAGDATGALRQPQRLNPLLRHHRQLRRSSAGMAAGPVDRAVRSKFQVRQQPQLLERRVLRRQRRARLLRLSSPHHRRGRSCSRASRCRWRSRSYCRRPPGQCAAPPADRFQARLPAPAAAAAIAPVATPANVRRVDDIRAQRREVREGDRTIIREPGRTIIREGNVTVIRRDESDRFRYGARNMIAERRGGELRTIAVRPDGTRIINVTDDSGRLIRRSRRDQFGREYVMFENSRPRMGTGTAIGIGVAAGLAAGLGVAYLANVPPPVVTLPPEQYIVDTRYAPPAMLYDTLAAPPVDVDRAALHARRNPLHPGAAPADAQRRHQHADF